jgi:hypothetical protein
MYVAGKRPRLLLDRDRADKVVVMPTVGYGLCRVQTCRVVGDLAAGLCVKHWDQGLDRRDKGDKTAVE